MNVSDDFVRDVLRILVDERDGASRGKYDDGTLQSFYNCNRLEPGG